MNRIKILVPKFFGRVQGNLFVKKGSPAFSPQIIIYPGDKQKKKHFQLG